MSRLWKNPDRQPETKLRKLTAWQVFMWKLKLEIFQAFRDRLRCPRCEAVGTWKPHSAPPRFLCKWCGYYEDARRSGWARPCAKKRVWMLKPLRPWHTPMERCGALDPWIG